MDKKVHRHMAVYGHTTWRRIGIPRVYARVCARTCVRSCVGACVGACGRTYDKRDKASFLG